MPANVLSKGDSAERLNLPRKNDSPQSRYTAKLRMEERKFKEGFEQEKRFTSQD